ncbi:MAG TPA: cob(I)yrinic acid a,c-diamide adenosyltransferase [Bacteroidota bacterium]|nr:cob(I)yrinic acid a,c-diamide adenosyltransferase [Bacteroidota bacterium]
MKIYTKTGDGGETSLFGGKRVPKDDLRIEAYGHVDELNSWIGLVRSNRLDADVNSALSRIQSDLFILGADLASPAALTKKGVVRVSSSHIAFLEQTIDRLDERLPKLSTFILPGGIPAGAQLHIARAVCRRAERAVVRLSKKEEVNDSARIYLNRLSDLLFVLARTVNRAAEVTEDAWTPPTGKPSG